MKKLLYCMLFSIALFSCDKDYVRIEKIRIRGQIGSGAMSAPAMSTRAPESGYSLADATKVLIFYGNEYDMVEIKNDGSFSGRAPLGSASCLVFLTSDNQFVGNLFAGGCHLLPLVAMDKSVSSINLSTLSLSGSRVIPSNDPIGSSIMLTDKELAFLSEVDNYYEALAENIDMNKDGRPDVQEGKRIELYQNHSFSGGMAGTVNSNPNVNSGTAINLNQSGIHLHGPNSILDNTDNSVAENARLSGPAGNPHNDIQSDNCYINNKEFKLNFFRRGYNQENHQNYNMPFDEGLYTLNIDNKTFTFEYKTVNMLDYLIFPVPFLHIDDSNRLTSITLSYQLTDGSEINPRHLMSSGIDLRIADMEFLTSPNAEFDDDYDYYTITFKNPINMALVNGLSLSYFDLLGNQYAVNWETPFFLFK